MNQGQKTIVISQHKSKRIRSNVGNTPERSSKKSTPQQTELKNTEPQFNEASHGAAMSSGQGVPRLPVMAYTVSAKKALADSFSRSSRRSGRNRTVDSRGKHILPWLAQNGSDNEGSFAHSRGRKRSVHRKFSNNADVLHVIPNAILEAVNETSITQIGKQVASKAFDLPKIQPAVVNVGILDTKSSPLDSSSNYQNLTMDKRNDAAKNVIVQELASGSGSPSRPIDGTLSKQSFENAGQAAQEVRDSTTVKRIVNSSATAYEKSSTRNISGLRVHLKSGAAQCSSSKRSSQLKARRMSHSNLSRNSPPGQLYQHTIANHMTNTRVGVILERTNEQQMDDGDNESLISLPQQANFLTTMNTRNASLSISRSNTKNSQPVSPRQIQMMLDRQRKTNFVDMQGRQLTEQQVAQIMLGSGQLNTPVTVAEAPGGGNATPLNQILKQAKMGGSRNLMEFSEAQEETEDVEPFRPLKPIQLSPPRNQEGSGSKMQKEHTAYGRTTYGDSGQKRKNSFSPRKSSFKPEKRYLKLVKPTLYDNELVLNKLVQIETAEERNQRTLHNGIMIRQKHIHVMRGIDNGSADKRKQLGSKEKVLTTTKHIDLQQPNLDSAVPSMSDQRCVTETLNYFQQGANLTTGNTQEINALHDSNSLVDSESAAQHSPNTATRMVAGKQPFGQVSVNKLGTMPMEDSNENNGLVQAQGIKRAKLIQRTMASQLPLNNVSMLDQSDPPSKSPSGIDTTDLKHNYVLDANYNRVGGPGSCTDTTHSNQGSQQILSTRMTAADLRGQFLPDENINRSKLQINQQLVKKFGAGSDEFFISNGGIVQHSGFSSVNKIQNQNTTDQKDFIASMICGIGASMSVKQTGRRQSIKNDKAKQQHQQSSSTQKNLNHDLGTANQSGSLVSSDERPPEDTVSGSIVKTAINPQIRESIVTQTKSAMRIYESKDLPPISPNLSVYVKQLEAKFDERTNRKQNMIKLNEACKSSKASPSLKSHIMSFADSLSEAGNLTINTNILTELQSLMKNQKQSPTMQSNGHVRMSSLQKPEKRKRIHAQANRSPKQAIKQTQFLLMSTSELQQRHRKFLGPMSPALLTIGVSSQSKASGFVPTQRIHQTSEASKQVLQSDHQTSDSQTQLPNALTAILNQSVEQGMQELNNSDRKLKTIDSGAVNTVMTKLSPWPNRAQRLDQGPSSRVMLFDEAYRKNSPSPTIYGGSSQNFHEDFIQKNDLNQRSSRQLWSMSNSPIRVQSQSKSKLIQISRQMNLNVREKPQKPYECPVVEKCDEGTLTTQEKQFQSIKVPVQPKTSSLNATHCSSKTLYQGMPRFQAKGKQMPDSSMKVNQRQIPKVAEMGTVMRTPDLDKRSQLQPPQATSSVVTPRDENDIDASEERHRRLLSHSQSEGDAVESQANAVADRPISTIEKRREQEQQMLSTHGKRKRVVEIKATAELMGMETFDSPQLTEDELQQLRIRQHTFQSYAPQLNIVEHATPDVKQVDQKKQKAFQQIKSMSPRRDKACLLDSVIDDKSQATSKQMTDHRPQEMKHKTSGALGSKKASVKLDPGNVRYKSRAPREAVKAPGHGVVKLDPNSTTQMFPPAAPNGAFNRHARSTMENGFQIGNHTESSHMSRSPLAYGGQNFKLSTIPNTKSKLLTRDASPNCLVVGLNNMMHRQYVEDGHGMMSQTMDNFYQAIKTRKNSDVIVRQIREKAVNEALLSPQLVVMPPFLSKRHTANVTQASIASKVSANQFGKTIGTFNRDLALNQDSQDDDDSVGRHHTIKIRALNDSGKKWVPQQPLKDSSSRSPRIHKDSHDASIRTWQMPPGFFDNKNTFNGGNQKTVNQLPLQRAGGVINGVHQSHMVNTSMLPNTTGRVTPRIPPVRTMVDSQCQVAHNPWPTSPSTTRVQSKMDPKVTSPLNRFPAVNFAITSSGMKNSGLADIHQQLSSNQSILTGAQQDHIKQLHLQHQNQQFVNRRRSREDVTGIQQNTSSVSNLYSNENERSHDEQLTTLVDYKSFSGKVLPNAQNNIVPALNASGNA